MNTTQDFFRTEALAFIYQPGDILINLAVACALGILISSVYKMTHKGLS